MSVSTHLYVSHRYGVEDVKTVLEKHLHATDVKIKSAVAPQMFRVTFKINDSNQQIYCHTDGHLPTGPCMLLSLGCNQEAIDIMRGIADVLGGILSDCEEKLEIIQGDLWEENGLLYFGTADGRICVFYNDPQAQTSYNDDGAAIDAYWETPDLDGQLFYKNKTFRFMSVRLQSAVATSIKIFVQKRGIWSFIKEESRKTRYFS